MGYLSDPYGDPYGDLVLGIFFIFFQKTFYM
jgi:hypothetical protein